MKKLLITLAMVLATAYTFAQTCKIKIFYDDNGNRILRALECAKPAPSGPTAINETENVSGGYRVYPNPTENKVNIKLDTDLLAKGCGISLTDITGKVLYQQRTITKAISIIDLQGFADGAYFIIINTENVRHTVKVVKQASSGY